MINEIKEITNLGGQVVIVLIFIAYLRQKDKLMKESQKDFVSYIEKHSDNGNLISARIQKFTDVIEELKNITKELKNLIKEQTTRIQEQTTLIHQLYERLVKLTIGK